ncbi:MAG: sialidase family protein [Longimicrobiales bacterium]
MFALLICCGSADQEADPTPLTSPAGPASGEPFLASAGGGLWMTWIEKEGAHHNVLAARFEDEWSEPIVVASGDDFFVNWADFPSIYAEGDTLIVHWLQRGSQGGYDYSVRMSWSLDAGNTWSDPWTPHEDGTPTEHGFVSIFSGPDGPAVVWLDGREMYGDEGSGDMGFRTRVLPIDGTVRDEVVLDDRTCECCQTDVTVIDGVPVVAYRDRGPEEIRNIHVVRQTASGWTEGQPVHDDGWMTPGCPVNGPALASRGSTVAVAWFTAPDDEPRVNVAFSGDGGVTFGPPARADLGSPSGRVDLVALEEGGVLLSWLERGPEGARILSRRIAENGAMGDVLQLARTSEERASGFPRIAALGSDRIAVAWTDATGAGQVHVEAYDLVGWDPPS